MLEVKLYATDPNTYPKASYQRPNKLERDLIRGRLTRSGDSRKASACLPPGAFANDDVMHRPCVFGGIGKDHMTCDVNVCNIAVDSAKH